MTHSIVSTGARTVGLLLLTAGLAGAQAAPAKTAPRDVASMLSNFKKPSDDELKKMLSPEQYTVTQHEGTELPYHNEFWNNHEPGIYVDIVSGEPLFSSLDKFESGTGWPSFTRPLEPKNLKSKDDQTLGMDRTEVRSKHADSHLGHVFDDGPKPTGLRYCINSAALRFIPASRLTESGYGQYVRMFGSAGK